jgi:hypothetical protein
MSFGHAVMENCLRQGVARGGVKIKARSCYICRRSPTDSYKNSWSINNFRKSFCHLIDNRELAVYVKQYIAIVSKSFLCSKPMHVQIPGSHCPGQGSFSECLLRLSVMPFRGDPHRQAASSIESPLDTSIVFHTVPTSPDHNHTQSTSTRPFA